MGKQEGRINHILWLEQIRPRNERSQMQVPINYTRSRVEGHQKGEPQQQKERSVVGEQGAWCLDQVFKNKERRAVGRI